MQKEAVIHRWGDHNACARICSSDSLLRCFGIGDEGVNTFGGRQIPTAQAVEHASHARPQESRNAKIFEVLILHFPCVAHGGVAVTEVQ